MIRRVHLAAPLEKPVPWTWPPGDLLLAFPGRGGSRCFISGRVVQRVDVVRASGRRAKGSPGQVVGRGIRAGAPVYSRRLFPKMRFEVGGGGGVGGVGIARGITRGLAESQRGMIGLAGSQGCGCVATSFPLWMRPPLRSPPPQVLQDPILAYRHQCGWQR